MKEADGVLNEEGTCERSVRFRNRLSPIDSSSDSDEGPKSEAISSSIYSGSNVTLRGAHEGRRKLRETTTPADNFLLSSNPEETKSTFTTMLPAEPRTWDELLSMSSLSSLDAPAPGLNLQPSSPIQMPPTSMFSRRAIPNDPVPPRPSSLPSTPKFKFDSPGSQS